MFFVFTLVEKIESVFYRFHFCLIERKIERCKQRNYEIGFRFKEQSTKNIDVYCCWFSSQIEMIFFLMEATSMCSFTIFTYWTKKKKIQKKVSFLNKIDERNPIGCYLKRSIRIEELKWDNLLIVGKWFFSSYFTRDKRRKPIHMKIVTFKACYFFNANLFRGAAADLSLLYRDTTFI